MIVTSYNDYSIFKSVWKSYINIGSARHNVMDLTWFMPTCARRMYVCACASMCSCVRVFGYVAYASVCVHVGCVITCASTLSLFCLSYVNFTHIISNLTLRRRRRHVKYHTHRCTRNARTYRRIRNVITHPTCMHTDAYPHAHTYIPVSYTHLDVYKRQILYLCHI